MRGPVDVSHELNVYLAPPTGQKKVRPDYACVSMFNNSFIFSNSFFKILSNKMSPDFKSQENAT